MWHTDGMVRFFDGRLVVSHGDITLFRGATPSAIVNAANSSLLGGGGVDGAIHRRGGEEILRQCREIRRSRLPDGLPTGEAVLTGGGQLGADYVIHTVGPVWCGGNRGEPALLRAAYRNSLLLAAEQRIREIAFPAISTGVFGYPPEQAAREVFGVVEQFLSPPAGRERQLPQTVHLLFYSEEAEQTFLGACQRAAGS